MPHPRELLHQRYLRGMVLGVLITGAFLGSVYAALVLFGTTAFSASALAAVLVISIPGGAILGAMLTADTDLRDN
jgi:hypothetical protein